MTTAPLSPVMGLPTYRGSGEEARLQRLLARWPRGLPFEELARGAADGVATYGALFALLTRGDIVSVELPDGQVGYRAQPLPQHPQPKTRHLRGVVGVGREALTQ